ILESHPAFATDIGESSDDPALAGLQALKYESEDPDANALSYKDEGNYHYKRKEFSKAIDSYSGGLRAKPKDMNLVAVLLTNRAICHWYLKNYRSCIMDCKAALVADPQHQKAYVKVYTTAVEACLALDKIHDCLELCELGLTKFPGCQKLTEARAKARQKQNLSDQAEIAKIKAQREEENKQLTTLKLITVASGVCPRRG
ncbi:tetratricopeptide repeat protein, partial [Opisthorchis viverrini]